MQKVKYPEDVGVSSKGINKLLTALKKMGAENHSLLIMRHGKVAFERYTAPYSAEMPHQLFSCTKALATSAVGFAIAEGKLKLTDRVVDFFSDYDIKYREETEKITLCDLLTMHSGKKFSFMQDMAGDYMQIFFSSPFRKDREFLYSNNDVHLAGVMVQRAVGESLVDYLYPRLFEKLGIEKPFWETDCKGYCVGGTGLYLKTPDLAKICELYLEKGKYNGEQILPKGWSEEATTERTKTSALFGGCGYGFNFWLAGDTVRMDGMFGQFGLIFKKQDAVIATTNCKVDEKAIIRAILDAENDIFVDDAKRNDRSEKEIECFYANESAKVKSSPDTLELLIGRCEKRFVATGVGAKKYKLMGFPFSIIPTAVYSSQAKRSTENLDNIVFAIDGDRIRMSFTQGEDRISFLCGTKGKAEISDISIKGYPFKIWAYAYREGEHLHVVYRPINTIASAHFDIEFNGREIKIRTVASPDMKEFCAVNGVAGGVIPNVPIIKQVACGAIKFGIGFMMGAVKYKFME